MKPFGFDVRFNESTHHFAVLVYPTRAAMVRAMKAAGYTWMGDAGAACGKASRRPDDDGPLGTLYFHDSEFTLDFIAHEASHAAHLRAAAIGLIPGSDLYDEQVADDTGFITSEIAKRRA